ncbi:MAG: hypothetical protein AB7U45_15895 [Desulfamplus sp.]
MTNSTISPSQFHKNISSFAAIIVDRITLKSPYYEDGDAQKPKYIYTRDFPLSQSMASFLDSQYSAFAMEHSVECCQNALMPKRFGIP